MNMSLIGVTIEAIAKRAGASGEERAPQIDEVLLQPEAPGDFVT